MSPRLLLLLVALATAIAGPEIRAAALTETEEVEDSPFLETRSGVVEGEYVNGGRVEAFKGIPFARAPVGELRWKAPLREASWNGTTKKTKKWSDACMQRRDGLIDAPPLAVSEDCLYLNVYRRRTANRTNVPAVMLFFHGGSYVYGTAGFLLYDGSNLVDMAHNEVIIVTANYRLGVFGYLGNDALRDTSAGNSSGNWGLQDQRAALEWVQENLNELSGGRGGQVTIFGESAGAGSVSAALVTPRSKGLFSRAIIESGPPCANWTSKSWETSVSDAKLVSSNLGCAEDDTFCLRSQNASAVLHAGKSVKHPVKGVTWSPVIDGVELSDSITNMLRKGLAHDVPVLIGSNKNEGTTFVSNEDMTPQQYVEYAHGRFGEEIGELVLKEYNVSAYATPWLAAVAALGDAMMTCPTRQTGRLLSMQGHEVYTYFLRRPLNAVHWPIVKKKQLGVFHGTDLFYVFQDADFIMNKDGLALADIFNHFWTSFAATGRPSSPGSLTWPRYNVSADINMDLDLPPALTQGLKKEKCDFWERLSFV